MKNKSLMILSVTLGMLCIVGTAYAHWSKTIYIEGYARTGTLDWVWTDVESDDPYSPNHDNNDGTCQDGFVPYGKPPFITVVWNSDKDVAWTEAGVDIEDPHWAWVRIHNGYPSYCVEVSTHPYVTGSIPIHLYEIIFKTADGQTVLGVYKAFSSQVTQLDVDQDGKYDIEIQWGEVFPQIDPYAFQYHYRANPEISFYIHILNDAKQMYLYEFLIELPGINYNEVVAFG